MQQFQLNHTIPQSPNIPFNSLVGGNPSNISPSSLPPSPARSISPATIRRKKYSSDHGERKCRRCGAEMKKRKDDECSNCITDRLRPQSVPTPSSSFLSSSSSNSSVLPPIHSLLARPASATPHTPLMAERRLGIIGAVEAEAPMDIIQQKSSVTLPTIHKLVDRYQTTGTVADLVHPDRHRGRPPSLDEEEKKKIINAWGCIAASGVGTLYLTTDTFDGPFYLKILKDCLLESKDNLNLPDDWKFLQDNARPHIESSVEEWIYKKNITMLHLPANSPDLNPIELIWSQLKPIVNNKFAKSLEELEDAAIEVWNSLSPDFIRNSIYDMRRRIQKVIKNNGNRIG